MRLLPCLLILCTGCSRWLPATPKPPTPATVSSGPVVVVPAPAPYHPPRPPLPVQIAPRPEGPPGVTLENLQIRAQGKVWLVTVDYRVIEPAPSGLVWYLEQSAPQMTLRWVAIPVTLGRRGQLQQPIEGFHPDLPIDSYLATVEPGDGPEALNGMKYTPVTPTLSAKVKHDASAGLPAVDSQ